MKLGIAEQDLIRLRDDCLNAQEEPSSSALLSQIGVPTEELQVTYLGQRAALLGINRGRDFYHHELRRRIPMPPQLEPEIAVWDGGTTPVWRYGILTEPKYFSFFQDSPHAAYNPNYRKKWRVHELLHGAVGFYWRPDITRFAYYVSARLNELLPVAHWYGLDEIFRVRCKEHRRAETADWCADCEALTGPYWALHRKSLENLSDDATRRASRTLEWVEGEIDTCLQEIRSLQVVPSASPFAPNLDSSSDAIAYMRAHWNRCTAYSFGSWVERFLAPGVDYQTTVEGLVDRVVETFAGLVGGVAPISVERFGALRARRMLQDLTYRALLLTEWLDPDSADGTYVDDALEPHFEAISALCQQLLKDDESQESAQQAYDALILEVQSLEPRLPEKLRGRIACDGFRRDLRLRRKQASSGEADHVADGLDSFFSQPPAPSDVEAFLGSEAFDTTDRLAHRFAHHMDDWTLKFEAWMGQEPHRDDYAENFASVPEDLHGQPGQFVVNKTLRTRIFPLSVLGEDSDEAATLACVYFGETPRVLVVDEEIKRILEMIERPIFDMKKLSQDHLLTLVSNGFVIFVPSVR